MPPKHPTGPNAALRLARQLRGWSQEELAEQVGTNAFTVSRWELGQAFPSPHYRQQLTLLFGQPPEALGLLPPKVPAAAASPALEPRPTTAGALVIDDPLLPPLPTVSTGLIGRETLLAQLKARLLAGETLVLSALHGLPGVGKTALALALAHDPAVRAHFADGLLWAGLGQTPQVQETLTRWGILLGLDPTNSRLTTLLAWAQALRTAIGTRQFLIVLDDAWRLEEVLACQVGGAGCAYLVTTRRPDLAGQVAGAGLASVHELSEAEGLTLLARLAPQVVADEPTAARELVQAVGGLPLGLHLLGMYLHREGQSGQPRRIRAALERLHQGTARLALAQPQAVLERHPSLPAGTPLSLQASIELSVAALPPEAQAMLAAVALFPSKPNSFSQEAALMVSAGTAETVDVLVAAGLVERMGARYTLHQTIADYAHLQGSPLQAAERMVRYCIAAAEAAQQEDSPNDQDAPVILAGMALACDQGFAALVVQGIEAVAPFLEQHGPAPLAERVLTWALAAAQERAEERGRLTCLLALARLAEKQGNYARAEALALEGVTLAQEQGQLGPWSALLRVRGSLAQRRGELDQADAFFQEGVILARQSGERTTLSLLLREVGALAMQRGDLAQTEAVTQEGFQVAQQALNRAAHSVLLQALGGIAAHRGKARQAELYKEAALWGARQRGDHAQVASLLADLGVSATNRGEFAQARTSFTEGLALNRTLGQPDLQCKLLLWLGGALLREGKREEGEPYVQEGLALARTLGHHHLTSTGLWFLSMSRIASGQLVEAATLAQQGLTMARTAGNRELEAYLLSSLGWIAFLEGAWEEAEAYLHAGLALNRATGAAWILPLMLNRLGELQLQQQSFEVAAVTFQEALALAQQQKAHDDLAWASFGLARATAGRGDLSAALEHGEACLQQAEAWGFPRLSENVRAWLASLRLAEQR